MQNFTLIPNLYFFFRVAYTKNPKLEPFLKLELDRSWTSRLRTPGRHRLVAIDPGGRAIAVTKKW